MKERDRRRLLEIQKRPRAFGAPLRPEHEQFLLSLSVNTLKWLNRLYQKLDAQDIEATGEELVSETRQLNKLDRAGLLSEHWWQDYEPGGVKPAVD